MEFGKFTRGENGVLFGNIRAVQYDHPNVEFRPTQKNHERDRDFMIVSDGSEIGSGWVIAEGERSIAVKLDDPLLALPVYAQLNALDDGYSFVWERPSRRR